MKRNIIIEPDPILTLLELAPSKFNTPAVFFNLPTTVSPVAPVAPVAPGVPEAPEAYNLGKVMQAKSHV